jgi:hypothetical protein
MEGILDPTQSFIVNKLMSSLHKISPTIDKRLPVTHNLLNTLISSIPNVCNSMYDIALYSAMFSIAYYACLRIGEYAMTGNSANVLKVEQVKLVTRPSVLNGQVIHVHFQHFKHKKHDVPVLELLPQSDKTCPVKLIKTYLQLRPKLSGPLFLLSSGQSINRQTFIKVFHNCIMFLSLDKKQYNTHSLRIGRCTDLMLAGVNESKIRAIGRWKSDAYKRYIRPSIVSV